MRRLVSDVPDFGAVISRARIIDAFERARPSLAVLVGPSGHGKSILASQIATREQFLRRTWIDVSGGDLSSDAAWHAVLKSVSDDGGLSTIGAVCAPIKQRPEESSLLAALMSITAGQATCLVLDGALKVWEIDAINRVAQLLSGAANGSCLVVTAREVDRHSLVAVVDPPFVVDAGVLRLADSEALELSALMGCLDTDDLDCVGLSRFCDGHAALFAVLAGHPGFARVLGASPRSDNVPLGVVTCLQHLIKDGLSEDEKAVFLAATLLGSSTPGCISRTVGRFVSVRALQDLSNAIPLVRVGIGGQGPKACSVHDLALSAVIEGTLTEDLGDVGTRVWASALAELEARGDFARIATVLLGLSDENELVRFVERRGSQMVLEGSLDTLRILLDGISVELRLQRPRLLLAASSLLRHSDRLDEAIDEAVVAAELSLHFGAIDDYLEASLLLGRMYIDKGMSAQALESLAPVARYQSGASNDVVALYHGMCANAQVGVGCRGIAEEHLTVIETMLAEKPLSADIRAQCLNWLAFMHAYVIGDTEKACGFLIKLNALPGLPRASRLQAMGNLGTLRAEMGRIPSAVSLLQETVGECRSSGLVALAHEYEGSWAMALAAAGQREAAEELAYEGIEEALVLGYEYSAAGNAVLRSAWRRAWGDLDGALSDVEGVIGRMPDEAETPVSQLARIEASATLFLMGENDKARASLGHLRLRLAQVGSVHHLLRADMVLAEIERQQGDADAAVARIAEHSDYILTESANWQIAMYIRAFPGLLGVFAKAIGSDAIPSHLLRMVLPEYARPALEASSALLSAECLERLAVRLLGKRGAAIFLRERANGPKTHVRLFGGMEVVTPIGEVTDKHWRKRKARLLFALLVLRRGHDMPREQIFEHFWPEMDEDRAKSNFYVTWSIMKRALALGAKDSACPYVEHVGGVCRVVPAAVSSDYAEFEDALVSMRKADRAGDTMLALASAERVFEEYRGELLPGELYDDWLGPMRDRCRHDYGDAMLRAAQLHHDSGDTEKALHMVRAALGQDPWREDLYQGALRYLIHSGQRSGAIETYVACKSKLAEDLGLDPSVETRRLYDQILAMEEPPAAPAQA